MQNARKRETISLERWAGYKKRKSSRSRNGQAWYIRSSQGNRLLVARSLRHLGRSFLYEHHKKNPNSELDNWRCKTCKAILQKAKRNGAEHVQFQIPFLTTNKDNIILGEVDEKHHSDCTAFSNEYCLALGLKREMYSRIEKTGLSVSEAQEEMLASLAVRCEEAKVDYLKTLQEMPELTRMRRTMQRHQKKCKLSEEPDPEPKRTKVQLVNLIPEIFKVTRRGRGDLSGWRKLKDEKWLRLAQEDPPLLFFSSDVELDIINSSGFFIGDTSFERLPEGFEDGQIMTLFSHVKGESVLVAVAFLSSRNSQICFEYLFDGLRDLLVQRNGGKNHSLETIFLDFESVASVAAREVFSGDGVLVKGCLFHFSRALLKQVALLCLHTDYGTNRVISSWIRRHFALALEPEDKIMEVWTDVLQNVPQGVQDPCLKLKCEDFAGYFRREWLVKTPLDLWNQYGNIGHQISDLAVPFHSRLRKVLERDFPEFDLFLTQLQIVHADNLRRIEELHNEGKPRREKIEDHLDHNYAMIVEDDMESLYQS